MFSVCYGMIIVRFGSPVFRCSIVKSLPTGVYLFTIKLEFSLLNIEFSPFNVEILKGYIPTLFSVTERRQNGGMQL